MAKLYRIAYCSRSRLTGAPDEVELAIRRLLATARTNNRKFHLTGALSFNENYFGQVLEGGADDLMRLMERVNQDRRHSQLKVLERVEITERSFPEWSMGYVATAAGEPHHPLAHFEFEAALLAGATSEARKLLNALRRVVGGKPVGQAVGTNG